MNPNQNPVQPQQPNAGEPAPTQPVVPPAPTSAADAPAAPVQVPVQPAPAAPSPTPPAVGPAPAVVTGGASPAAPESPLPAPRKSFKKVIIVIIVGVVLFMGLGLAGFFFLLNGGDYSKLETQTSEEFSVDIPKGWEHSEESSGAQTYYDGTSPEESKAAVAVASQPMPEYAEASQEERDSLISNLISILEEDGSQELAGSVENISEFTINSVKETQHSVADRAVVIEFTGKQENGVELKGELYWLFTADGHLHVVFVGAETPVWDKNIDNFHSMVESFKPN